MKSFAHFFLYNNLVPIAFGILFLGSAGALAATPAVQDAVLSSNTVVQTVDNSYIVSADVANYVYDIQVTAVSEDTEKYYIEYTLKTIDVENAVWRDVVKVTQLIVDKRTLGERDLGLYVTTQLAQVRDAEKVRLIETQRIERSLGITQKVVATTYSGLVGRMLSPTEEVFEGYVPVVEEASPTIVPVDATNNAPLTVVNDTTPPAITLIGENPMRIVLQSIFTDPGVVVTGEDPTTITIVRILDSVEVSTFDTLDTTRVNSYVLTYRVTDSAGNSSEVRREVVVDGTTNIAP